MKVRIINHLPGRALQQRPITKRDCRQMYEALQKIG
jgi:hypothetical protein